MRSIHRRLTFDANLHNLYMYGSSMDYVCGSGSDVPVEGMASRLMGLDLRPHLRVALG